MIKVLTRKLSLLNAVNNHSELITNDLNHESNFVHSVQEYDLALNISQIHLANYYLVKHQIIIRKIIY